MTDIEVVDHDNYTEITVHDYDALDRAMRFTPMDKPPSKPVLVKFVETDGNARYIRPPRYHTDGTCMRSALELIYDRDTRKVLGTRTYTEMVAKHVIRVKQANGYDHPLIIYNIKERDLKDDLFMRGLLFDEWDPYLTRSDTQVTDA